MESSHITEKARQNLERNEFLRRLEFGLEPIPPLNYSTYAYFDAERIEAVTKVEEVDGNRVLKFNFKYTVGVDRPDPEIGVRLLTVDAKISAKIDLYLYEGINVLNIKIIHTGKGTKYKIEPFEPVPSVPEYRTALPLSFWKYHK
jgi:hypothetical protein